MIPEHEGAGSSRGRPLSKTRCALALVTGGLTVVAVMLHLVTSAQPVQTSGLASLPQEESERQSSALAESLPAARAELVPRLPVDQHELGGHQIPGRLLLDLFDLEDVVLGPEPHG